MSVSAGQMTPVDFVFSKQYVYRSRCHTLCLQLLQKKLLRLSDDHLHLF